MEILKKKDIFPNKIDAPRSMEGEMLGYIKNYYRVGLKWTSNALEGNSLTKRQI